MDRRFTLSVVLVGMLVLSGCIGKQHQHEVHFNGPVTYENATFSMNDTVTVIGGTAPAQR